jgi:chemotaxis protein histidine kinase CheA
MDALLSNQLSRGLGEVAHTFGQYAMAAHEERLQAAKEQFAAMLDEKKQQEVADRENANEAQRAADHAADRKLTMQQHAEDKAQQASQFQSAQDQRERLAGETRAQEAQRIELARQAAARADKAASGDKPATAGERLAFAQNAYRDASAEYTAAVKAAGDSSTLMDDKSAAAAKAAVADKLTALLHAKRQMVSIAKSAGLNLDDATTAPAAAPATPDGGVKVMKDGKGNFYKTAPDGSNPVPITPQEAKQLYQAPTADTSPVATPAVNPPGDPSTTSGAYAQAPSTVPPDPTNATPVIGQPDNPTLAS